jgi:hypothetical protein
VHVRKRKDPSAFYKRLFWDQVRYGDAFESVALVGRLAREAPDDEYLRAIGIDLIEPLLDCHHEVIFETFLSEAEHNWKLRKACSSAWIHIPAEKAVLLTNLIAHDPERPRA